MTIADFRDEVKVALGETIDDAIWGDAAIEYNIRLATNKLAKQILSKKHTANDMRSVVDMVSTVVLPLQTDATLEYRYIDLPGETYSLPNGLGINYASYYRQGLPPNCPPQVARAQFWITTWRELPLLYADPLQKPSAQRPRFIPTETQVYFFGLEAMITQVQMGLFLAMDPDSTDDTEVLRIPPEALFDLRRMVLNTGSWVLLSPNERLLNEGDDFPPRTIRPTPPPQVISVNDPILTTPD